MTDPVDSLETYARKTQMNFFQGIYNNKFKQQLAHKRDFIRNAVSQNMSSSVPSYAYDQLFVTYTTYLSDPNTFIVVPLFQEHRLDQTFMAIDTDYKTIGLREIRVIPNQYHVEFIFVKKDSPLDEDEEDEEEDIIAIPEGGSEEEDEPPPAPPPPPLPPIPDDLNEVRHKISFYIESDKTFEACLNGLTTQIQFLFGPNFDFTIVYLPQTSELVFKCDTEFTFEFQVSPEDGEGLENWLKFLNVAPDKMEQYVSNPTSQMTFQNVWERKYLYVYSSIANNSPTNYLGHENEFYETPTKLYKWTSHSNTFRILFSLDTKTPFHLYWQTVHVSFQLLATVLK
jgi:hypothetical protein